MEFKSKDFFSGVSCSYMMAISSTGLFVKHSRIAGKSQSLLGVELSEIWEKGCELSSSFSVVSYLMRSATCPVMMFQPSSLSTRLYRTLVCNFQNWAQTNLFSLPGNNCRHRVSLQWQDADQYKDLLWVSLATTASHAPVRSPQLSGIVKALSVWLEKNLLVLQFTDWEWWE